MELDHPYFYVFVRRDISLAQQIVQTNHATYEMAVRFANPNLQTSIVLIGVADKTELEQVMERLDRYKIAYQKFEEPDFDMGLSAVATLPILTKRQRKALSIYKLWEDPYAAGEVRATQTADANLLSV